MDPIVALTVLIGGAAAVLILIGYGMRSPSRSA